MKNFLKSEIRREKNFVKEIWDRLRNRNFSGNTGLAIKNSVYQISTSIFAKLGSFLFVVIVARLLLPEMFGLYSLALSTILIFNAVSELGINETVVRFVSREFGKKRGKVKEYLIYLGRIKIILVLFSGVLLLVSSKYLSNNFYQKPISLALLAGILYIMALQMTGFLQSALQATNHFSSVSKREAIFQILRLVFVPLSVVLALKYSLQSEILLMVLILALSLSFFISSLFLFLDMKGIYSNRFINKRSGDLNNKEKILVNKFLFATIALSLSRMFFGNIDKVMLGRFVQPEFIGYYTAAFGVISSLVSIIGFSSIALLPIFSRLRDKRLESGFRKSIRVTFIFAFVTFLGTLVLSYLAILILYGREYLPAANVLKISSVLLFVLPLTAVYQSYYISTGKPQTLVWLLVFSTLLNIILNYFFIVHLLPRGDLAAVYGVALSTIISQFFYLGGLVLGRKRFSPSSFETGKPKAEKQIF